MKQQDFSELEKQLEEMDFSEEFAQMEKDFSEIDFSDLETRLKEFEQSLYDSDMDFLLTWKKVIPPQNWQEPCQDSTHTGCGDYQRQRKKTSLQFPSAKATVEEAHKAQWTICRNGLPALLSFPGGRLFFNIKVCRDFHIEQNRHNRNIMFLLTVKNNNDIIV